MRPSPLCHHGHGLHPTGEIWSIGSDFSIIRRDNSSYPNEWLACIEHPAHCSIRVPRVFLSLDAALTSETEYTRDAYATVGRMFDACCGIPDSFRGCYFFELEFETILYNSY